MAIRKLTIQSLEINRNEKIIDFKCVDLEENIYLNIFQDENYIPREYHVIYKTNDGLQMSNLAKVLENNVDDFDSITEGIEQLSGLTLPASWNFDNRAYQFRYK